MKSKYQRACSCYALLCLLVLLFPRQTFAQLAAIRPCGTDIMLQQWRNNPQFLAREQYLNKAILERQQQGFRANVNVTLPVVVHIINENPSSITDADVAQAIQTLNDAYAAQGSFSGGRTNTNIQFCLAKTAPDGSIRTGITRSTSYLTDFDADMEGDRITAMGKWDGSRYINIWVVTDIKSEFMQSFECGQWTRLKMGGYAGAGGDIVVAGLGVGVLAHEMGHYLSLAHTFANRDCKNDDCTTDGDMVCDTPPEKTITGGYACTAPENSCDTDTLSGFTVDVTDLPDNFMDYGQGTGCILGFTPGQADRMHNFINAALPLMINSNVCTPPCSPTALAGFTRAVAYPLTGDNISLTNTTTGTASYQWLVDGTPTATTTDFTLTVTDKRNYIVTLLATAGGCTSTFTDVIEVSCGVVARFYPDKRKIASKAGVELDKILFKNRSRNATAYKWLMSNDQGMTEQVISTDTDLDFTFLQPGLYNIRLIATNGACTDTTAMLHITVDDPTPDAAIYVTKVECYQQDKIRMSMYFYNGGYKTIPKGTPVAFYDKDPRKPGAARLGDVYLIPSDLRGKCATPVFTSVVDVQATGLDSIVAVINDNGTTLPLALPNTGVEEVRYTNNVVIKRNFRFKPVLDPSDLTVKPFESIDITPKGENGDIAKAQWLPVDELSCTDCITTTYTAPYRKDTVTTRTVQAYSKLGCYDNATATIHVPIVDDYTVQVRKLICAADNYLHVDFTICNNFIKGNIPAGLTVKFFDGDPAAGHALQLGNAFVTTSYSAAACGDYEFSIPSPASGQVFAVIATDPAAIYPPATGLSEVAYDNNNHQENYTAPTLAITPADTTVYRKDLFQAGFETTLAQPYTIRWSTAPTYNISCTTCEQPQFSMKSSDKTYLELVNNYGCKLNSSANFNIFSPDFTLALKEAHCFRNGEVIVSFDICMNNGYDTVVSRIPVTFYDMVTNEKLGTVFYTTLRQPGNCHTYTHTFPAPADGHGIIAVINSDGTSNSNGTAIHLLPETDYTNNGDDINYTPFAIKVTPATTNLLRPAQIPLGTTVSGDAAIKYTWTPADGLSCNNCPNPVVTARSSMKYTVTVNNNFFCTASADATILTSTLERISMPTAFTPNGDGQNDIFYIIGTADIRIVKSFSIFNRLGNKVFERFNIPANDKAYGWNGQVNGNTANMDSYVFFANIEYNDGTTEMVKGSFLLLK
ncbi:T9SS type B sorting domain-containing protein [Chitinophaga sp. sic0106]|uniref:T9SS type B sorting domain-containing protein n=1 Tax=Chitinophaga sp. sic0106 TaxID=2854785 RepID=UPI001C466844|nr:T9SS type B sorting domain-containing protein [Chitinophaga sp. sic0106]MBV7533206.1 gliding motility-associated C-terminal domain-containing protein [Chitinophaga sp. sic0106]